jgi:nucleoside phosphorylase
MSDIIRTDTNEKLLSYFTDIDIGVVTALQTELDALIKLSTKHETIVGEKRTYHKLTFKTNEKEFTVIAHTLNNMGISSMSITLMELIYGFPQLKYLALIGIAAGSSSKDQNFGDILIPKTVYNYESGKYIEIKKDGNPENNEIKFNSDYSSFPIDTDILQKITAVTSDQKILDAIMNSWSVSKSYKLKVHSGNFACGSAVIASMKKVKQIEDAISRKYIGIDMETFALASVNQLKHNHNPKMFIIKAITDFADSDKDDSEHEFASYTAAKVFLEVCSLVLVGNSISTTVASTEKTILILSATYEWPNGQEDVTKQIKEFVEKGIITIVVDPATFQIKDPAYGVVKTLSIHCKINGQERILIKKDGERFRIE